MSNIRVRPDYGWWVEQQFWTLSEFACLANGLDPRWGEETVLRIFDCGDPDQSERRFAESIDLVITRAHRSIEAGALKVRSRLPRIKDGATPSVWVRWALERGLSLPTELLEFAENIQHDPVVACNEEALTPQERRKQRTRSRDENIRRESKRLQAKHSGERAWTRGKIASEVVENLALTISAERVARILREK